MRIRQVFPERLQLLRESLGLAIEKTQLIGSESYDCATKLRGKYTGGVGDTLDAFMERKHNDKELDM